MDRERATLAEGLLRRKDVPLSKIAALLGYSEQSSLTRGFRRWFDETPAAARRRMRGTALAYE